MKKVNSIPRKLSWLISTTLLAAFIASLVQPASAHRPSKTPAHKLTLKQVLEGDEVKRTPNSGKGMPSIMGPFPDTLNMEWLGQVVNRDLGASRLIWSGATFLSDIWGWTSPEGEEYAIVGHNSGVAFVRVTDPTKPVYLGTVPTINTGTQRNFWWDIKTYNHYAYFVSEVSGTGVGIVDLDKIDAMDAAPDDGILEVSSRYDGNGLLATHNISINEGTGYAYLTGVTKDKDIDTGFVDNGMVILDLNGDPLHPVEVGQILGHDTHDAHVISYNGPDSEHAGKELAFVFNGVSENIGIYDVTNKTTIDVRTNHSITISESEYAGASFTHQGWVTEDQHFMVAGDEEDELFGLQDPQNSDLPDTARTYVWNIQDLDNPKLVSTFDSPAASIDHNLFTRVDGSGREFVYQANYTAGIRVTELTRNGVAGPDQTAQLEEVAHMDTEPRLPNNNLNFNFNIWEGPWGVYPFLGSGTIMASDGLNGLVLMKLDLE
jgi:choice-of-anchor B domain-containing protein